MRKFQKNNPPKFVCFVRWTYNSFPYKDLKGQIQIQIQPRLSIYLYVFQGPI